MKVAEAIIGANYGDEGKGLITDYLCDKLGADLVVRYNGGAQAGHTVVTPEGKRHVHNHLGSGTLLGVPTYLSKFFIVNPLIFNKEQERLAQLSLSRPAIYVDPECVVTTPYDMIINQVTQKYLTDLKHTSCGVGIKATMARSQYPKFTLKVKDLLKLDLRNKLKEIRDEYYTLVLRNLPIADLNITCSEGELDLFFSDDLLSNFERDCYEFASKKIIFATSDLISDFKMPIFEGAQGLLLDQDHSNAPFVTMSRTGIINVLTLCREVGITNLNVNYITRCYVTRHGAGPMLFELKEKPFIRVDDLTNVENPYQGPLRYANLNSYSLVSNILKDLANARGFSGTINPSISMTCLDQASTPNDVIIREQLVSALKFYFPSTLKFYFPVGKLFNRYVSYGNTRKNIVSGS